jgi:hypothetical protein
MSDGHWQLEGSAAELYQRYLVPAITTKWADDLVHRAQLRAGEDVWMSLAAPGWSHAWLPGRSLRDTSRVLI